MLIRIRTKINNDKRRKEVAICREGGNTFMSNTNHQRIKNHPTTLDNLRGEPMFSVMAADWFCEKSGWIGKVEDVKPVL